MSTVLLVCLGDFGLISCTYTDHTGCHFLNTGTTLEFCGFLGFFFLEEEREYLVGFGVGVFFLFLILKDFTIVPRIVKSH